MAGPRELCYLVQMILSLFFAFAAAQSQAQPADVTFNAQVASKAPYTLKFTPPSGHHFNLQAPARVALSSGEVSQLKKDEHQVTAEFKTAKLEKECTVQANLYVCNDANTYCRPVKRDFDCSNLKSK